MWLTAADGELANSGQTAAVDTVYASASLRDVRTWFCLALQGRARQQFLNWINTDARSIMRLRTPQAFPGYLASWVGQFSSVPADCFPLLLPPPTRMTPHVSHARASLCG